MMTRESSLPQPALSQHRLALAVQGEHFGPTRTAAADLPNPQAFARKIGQAVVDVSTGRRPVAQIQRYVSAEIGQQLARRAALARRLQAGQAVVVKPERLRSVHVCTPDDGVAEVSAVISVHDRVRAAAFRMEGIDGRWQITALTIA